jgi:colanic acid biosynthesis glycosyl transferase WcaI
MRKQTVYFVNQYGWPDGAATAQLLCQVLRGAPEGVHIVLIQSSGQYTAVPTDGSPPNIEIRRLWAPRIRRERMMGKFLGFAAFYIQAAWAIGTSPLDSDVVVMTTPPFLNWLGMLSKWIKRGRVIAWEMDVYPEILFSTGVIREHSWIGRALKWLTIRVRARTDMTIVLGPCMGRVLKRGGISSDRCFELHNWADGSQLYPVSTPGSGDALKILYSGNLGVAHDLPTVVKAIEDLTNESAVNFVFAGSGVGMAQLRTIARKNVHFQPPCGIGQLNLVLNSADIGLVTQTYASLGCVVPSKFYGILAAGRGVLYVGPPNSTIAEVIRATECGWVVNLGDSEGMVRLIGELVSDRSKVQLAGARARKVFEQSFTREQGVARFWELMKEVEHLGPC